MKISIAICTCNGAGYLEEQLESLLAQTHLPDEWVICDDLSEDATPDILKDFTKRCSGEVRLVFNPCRIGSRRNFEQAINLCTGDVIFLCDQDDVWLPGKVEAQLAYLLLHPEAGAVFCNGELMDASGRSLAETMWDALYFEAVLQAKTNQENLLYYLLVNGNLASGTALCLRRDCLQRAMPFPPNKELWHDFWLALVSAAGQELHMLPLSLLRYRIHQGQQVGFQGRGMSDPAFRQVVHNTWLYPHALDADGSQTTHLAWAVMRAEELTPLLAKRVSDAGHIQRTLLQIHRDFRNAQRSWLRTIPWRYRKWKLLKHWLKGGEYLRIGLKELCTI